MAVTLVTGAIVQGSDAVNTAAVVAGDLVTLQAVKPLSLGGSSIMPTVSMEFV
jgi:hypothetical protein